MAKVKIYFKTGEVLEVTKGILLDEVARSVQSQYPYPIMAGQVGYNLKELASTVEDDLKDFSFIDLSQKDGIRIYQRSMTFVLVAAAKRVVPECHILVNHHITGGYFCEFQDMSYCTKDNITAIAQAMQDIVAADLPIEKSIMPVAEAMAYFQAHGLDDKVKLFKYRRTSTVNIYTLDGVKDYFYGYMLPSTRVLNLFELIPYAHGFILQFPSEKTPNVLAPFKPQPKLSSIFRESEAWARILGVDVVGALNDAISAGETDELIKVSEALHEKKIASIADKILDKGSVKLVMIAGPSSSGKTTFAKRLCIQLRVNGMKPHLISIDDYFVDREKTPRDEAGNYDFEALEAIDIDLFNEHMKRLISGEVVEIPSFNFVKGKREYKGNKMHLGTNDILVIEGIHGLNEKLSYAIPKANKYKVYVSCLTQLNIDEHNRIPTTDTRLIRRMVRDYAYRGTPPELTL